MLFLFEYRGAKILITEQFPDTAGSIVSIAVDSDVVSLDGREFLQTEAEIKEDGKLHVTVRRSNASRSDIYSRRSQATPRPSNLTNAEIYSLQSSRNPTPRGSSFNHTDFYSMVAAGRNSNFGPTEPRTSNFEEESSNAKSRFHYLGGPPAGMGGMNYPAPNPGMFSPTGSKSISTTNTLTSTTATTAAVKRPNGQALSKSEEGAKDLHMFVWSSSASPVSDVFANGEYGGGGGGGLDSGVKEVRMGISPAKVEGNGEQQGEYMVERDDFSFGNVGGVDRDGQGDGHGNKGSGGGKAKAMPPASVMTRLILIMVWRKLIRNPNTYSSLIGLTWSLVSFKWNVKMPAIVAGSISILSDAGLGMAMFSLGLFMALQPRIIACGNSVAAFAMAVRFLTGPAVMAVASIAVGLRGALLRIAIVQAALPQGIVPFVFAKEYNVHPDILSTAVIFGMLIALPITLVYYILLGL